MIVAAVTYRFSRQSASLAEQRRRRRRTKLRFGWLPFGYLNLVSRRCWPSCSLGQRWKRTEKRFKVRNTPYQPSYHSMIANTSIGAAILFSHHPYIGTHYHSSLIHEKSRTICVIMVTQSQTHVVVEMPSLMITKTMLPWILGMLWFVGLAKLSAGIYLGQHTMSRSAQNAFSVHHTPRIVHFIPMGDANCIYPLQVQSTCTLGLRYFGLCMYIVHVYIYMAWYNLIEPETNPPSAFTL